MDKNIKNERENKFLNMPEEFNSTVEKYDFELENPSGLNYVSDTALEIAFRLIKDGKIKLIYKPETEEYYPEIVIQSELINFCNQKITSEELLEDMKNNMENYLTNENEWEIEYKADTINSICTNCQYDKCPKVLAAYVLYLYGKGELENKLKERAEYRKNNITNNKFDFIWNVKDGLKNVSEETFEFCKKIVDNNCIWVSNVLTEDGSIKIESLYSCSEYKKFNNDITKLTAPTHGFENFEYLERSINTTLNYCEAYSCRLAECPFIIAGYIYYLQREGKYDQIEADRKYYKKHKQEIDNQIKENKKAKLLELNTYKNDILDNFNEMKDKVQNLKAISEIISNESQTNFHCIIEGNDQETKEKLVNKIAELLYQKGKISSEEIVRLSMQNLASYNTYKTSYDVNKNDKNGVPYHVEEAVKYTELEENKLYVINGLTEFIFDYRKALNSTEELREKQFRHVLNLLTKMETENYIILMATEKEIEELLAIDPKIRFIYQNYIYKVKDLSLDEIYELYVSKIKSDLLDDLRSNYEKYKKKFKEYVSLNQKFIPFSNRELATYLADYSNAKNKIVFPENMYKRETVEESLSNIIGLEMLKEKVKEFEKYMLFQVKAKANGLKLKNANMHMIFTGNPGTGKTTIARIMAKMLFDLGIIKENKLIEVENKDLIASYIGQTAPKTAEVISKAMGGVLFIDETYSLTQGSSEGGNTFRIRSYSNTCKSDGRPQGRIRSNICRI